MKKRKETRNKIFHRAVSILLSGSLILTGQVVYAEEKQPNQTVFEEETEYLSDTVYGENGFSYRLYYENDTKAASVGKRRAGVQEPLAEITAYSGTDTEITIPGIIDGNEVKSIGNGAFKDNAEITRVTIAEGITSIGYEAFSGCTNLAAVSIPSTITNWNDSSLNSYDSSAFKGCVALSELDLAEGLKVLGQKAFQGCTSLAQVSVPSTIEEMHNQVFSGCSALNSLELKEGIRQIGYRAFENCTALEEVDIPSTIESWGKVRANGVMNDPKDSAPFLGCTSLKSIHFQEGLKTLKGFQGSRGCPLVKELVVPASVEDIAYAFTDCSGLESVTLQEGLESIGESAFQRCSALQEIQIPDTVVSVEANAFRDCIALERLVFPPAAVSLKGSITFGCTGLKELYLLAEAVDWYQALSLASDGKLYCLEGSRTYETYNANMPEADREKLTFVPSAEVEAEGCTLAYDGKSHAGVAVKGTQEGDIIRYSVDGKNWQEEVPEFTEPGEYQIFVTVKRFLPGETLKYSSLKVESRIQKRQYSLHLSDVEVTEGETYNVVSEGYEGTEKLVYTYYRDNACTLPVSGKPSVAGVYYVRAEVPETEYDAVVKSNVAKITILSTKPMSSSTPDPGGNDPGASPSANPGGNDPEASPSANPGGSDPGASPSANPGGSDPGKQPGTSPSTTPGGITSGVSTGGNGQGNKITSKPQIKRVSLAGVKAGKKKVTVRWKKISTASGYQVQTAFNKKFTKGKKSCLIKKGKTTKKTISGLKGKKVYYVRVRGYCLYQGQKIYGKWSKVKKVKVK